MKVELKYVSLLDVNKLQCGLFLFPPYVGKLIKIKITQRKRLTVSRLGFCQRIKIPHSF